MKAQAASRFWREMIKSEEMKELSSDLLLLMMIFLVVCSFVVSLTYLRMFKFPLIVVEI